MFFETRNQKEYEKAADYYRGLNWNSGVIKKNIYKFASNSKVLKMLLLNLIWEKNKKKPIYVFQIQKKKL